MPGTSCQVESCERIGSAELTGLFGSAELTGLFGFAELTGLFGFAELTGLFGFAELRNSFPRSLLRGESIILAYVEILMKELISVYNAIYL
ncbi:MAG: hypothetical protein ISS19_16245 [Bacteroidales bacterium]|nr:hypothetical protein [Bacteroidales bacterium]